MDYYCNNTKQKRKENYYVGELNMPLVGRGFGRQKRTFISLDLGFVVVGGVRDDGVKANKI